MFKLFTIVCLCISIAHEMSAIPVPNFDILGGSFTKGLLNIGGIFEDVKGTLGSVIEQLNLSGQQDLTNNSGYNDKQTNRKLDTNETNPSTFNTNTESATVKYELVGNKPESVAIKSVSVETNPAIAKKSESLATKPGVVKTKSESESESESEPTTPEPVETEPLTAETEPLTAETKPEETNTAKVEPSFESDATKPGLVEDKSKSDVIVANSESAATNSKAVKKNRELDEIIHNSDVNNIVSVATKSEINETKSESINNMVQTDKIKDQSALNRFKKWLKKRRKHNTDSFKNEN